ncbi:curlin subunit CsgB [Bradyrhizobium sp. CB1650]|uniref:curlin subunit CsgB n=1 Tax=Bradyrhizobium sp. CB1650 TaxID=3039153 RepID=UPI002435863A|nr:curlin subunit CsgB [Bradyrhizobium sp. CB1650]WGD56008.1 curlin subunit CsgB [Bradyrhizobium sp. CB1650]
MRKLLLASATLLALSSAAHAANTATTVQMGGANSSTVTQNGVTNDTSNTTQVGFFNSATTLQGLGTPSLNNASTVSQTGGIVNTATTMQNAFFNNNSSITQSSFPLAPPSNSATVGQNSIFLFGNTSTINQH